MKHLLRSSRFWVAAAAVAFFLFYGLVLVFRHLNYYTAQFDLGNMDQVMWQTMHGRWFQMVDTGNGTLISRFVYHADVLLLAYLPFYAVVGHPITLTLIQLLAVTSAVFPLFWFGKKHLPTWVAALASSTLLMYPPLIWNVLFDVHAVTLVIPLFIWAAWAAVERRWWIFAVCVALLPLGKEEVGGTVALFGAILAWKIRPRWIGIVTTLYGIAVACLMLFVVIPHVRHSADHFFLAQYSQYGTTTGGVVAGMLRHPLAVLRTMLDHSGRQYIYHLIGPFAGLPILALPFVLVAGPEYAINTLSSFEGMQSIVFQYTSVLTPILLLSMMIGLTRWWTWTKSRRKFQLAGIIMLVGSSLFFLWHDAPFPLGRHHDVMNVFRPSPYRATIADIKRQVKSTDALSVTNNLGPQFSRRDRIFGFPNALEQTDAIVTLFDQNDQSDGTKTLRDRVESLRHDPEWLVIIAEGELTYLRRVGR